MHSLKSLSNQLQLIIKFIKTFRNAGARFSETSYSVALANEGLALKFTWTIPSLTMHLIGSHITELTAAVKNCIEQRKCNLIRDLSVLERTCITTCKVHADVLTNQKNNVVLSLKLVISRQALTALFLIWPNCLWFICPFRFVIFVCYN